jgi:hypothetical protein
MQQFLKGLKRPRGFLKVSIPPFQLIAHHQLRPPSTRPFVEPPCSAFRRSRSAQRSSICRRPGVSSQVNTGNAHQTKEARRVESASFLRGYARGALGAIRDCREDTERLLRKCGAASVNRRAFLQALGTARGTANLSGTCRPPAHGMTAPAFTPWLLHDIPARRMRPEYRTQRVPWRTQRP